MKKLELKNRKGQKIVGLLNMPEGVPQGTVVIQHGWGGTKEGIHILKIEQAFRVNGFMTFNFDATNSFGESDGTYWESRLGLHTEDLEDVAKWIQQQEYFVKPFALTGHSMGGYAVAKYAEKYPGEVAILVPIAPVVSGRLSWETRQERNAEEFEAFQKRGYQESISQTTGKVRKSPWAEMEERLNHDLLPDAGKISMPTLLIVGTQDESCRPQDVKRLYDALPENSKNQYREILDAPHTYRTEEHLKELYNIINNWLKDL